MVRQELGQIMQPDKLVNVALLLTHFCHVAGLLRGDNPVVCGNLFVIPDTGNVLHIKPQDDRR
jgi:hypothetical protein